MTCNGMHQYHPQWPPAQPPTGVVVVQTPPPPAHHSPMSMDNRLVGDEIRMIFISGLPEDVKERELQNLQRWLADMKLRWSTSKAKSLWVSPFSPHQILSLPQRHPFRSVLHTEMAKKNLFVKRGIVPDPNSFDQSKSRVTGGDYTHTGFSSPSPFHPPPAPVWGPHGYKAPPPAPIGIMRRA